MLSDMNANPTVAVKNLNAAKDFYEQKLGLEPVDQFSNDYVKFFRAGNTQIELYESQFAGTNQATALTFGLGPKFENEIERLQKKGVRFEHYPDMPNVKIEGDIHIMGEEMRAAWFKDPDGNIICLHDK